MRILAIETSCDETAVAIVENGTQVLANVIASQIPLHKKTGGVVPEVAAREHVLKIIPVLDQALKDASLNINPKQNKPLSFEDIDAIAFTQGPGLLSSLIIGMVTATTLSILKNKTLIPVNHISGHIYANWLVENNTKYDEINFPILILTVSGGHNDLILMRDHSSFELIGETLDDAGGEAFDKVSRMLNLGYPGGPIISKTAESGDPKAFSFPRVHLSKNSFDFSFSGLKTAVLNLVKKEFLNKKHLSKKFISDCSASFQEAVCEVLADKLLKSANLFNVKEVHLAGGVSANKRLREITSERIKNNYYLDHNGKRIKLNINPKLRYSKNISFCTDNASMIASSAYFQFKNSKKSLKDKIYLPDPSLKTF